MILYILPLLLLLLSPALATAQSNPSSTCPDGNPFASGINATGNATFPAPQTQPAFLGPPAGNWTVHTAIKQRFIPSQNASTVESTFWLDTTPLITTSPSDLTFTGCAWTLRMIDMSKSLTSAVQNNSCDGIINSVCLTELTDAISGNLSTALTQANSPGSGNDACAWLQSLVGGVSGSPQCKGSEWGLTAGTEPFGNPSFKGAGWAGSCIDNNTEVNPFNGNATYGAFSSVGSFNLPVGNETYYDQMVVEVMPVVFIVWPKESGNETPSPDTRVVCVSANNVQPGSKVPNAASSWMAPGAMVLVGWVTVVLTWSML